MRSNPKVSVVVIGRNCSRFLPHCVESIQNSFANAELGTNDFEIIYVDSKSEDNSPEIAHALTDSVVQVTEGFCSAAFGRFLGTEAAKYPLTLYLDSDMELDPNWIRLSLPSLLEHGAIIGQRREVIYSSDWSQIVRVIENFTNISHEGPAKHVGGFLFIDRDRVGVARYCSLVESEEERDFYSQFIKDIKIIQQPYPAYSHHTLSSLGGKLKRVLPPGEIGFIYSAWRSWKRGYLFGYLQVQRNYLFCCLASLCLYGTPWLGWRGLFLWLLCILASVRGRRGVAVNSILLPWKLISAYKFYSQDFKSTVKVHDTVKIFDHKREGYLEASAHP